MITITPDNRSLKSILDALDQLAGDGWLRDALDELKPKVQAIELQRRADVAKLPYSPKYLGKKKPSGKVIAGGAGDQGYAIDTGAFWGDLVGNWQVGFPAELGTYSDLVYASRLAGLAEDKGQSVWGEDDEFLSLAEKAVIDELDRIW